MWDLRELFTAVGLPEAQSVLQTGNIIFKSHESRGDKIEDLLETETKKRFGGSIDYFVRTAQEWKQIVARNPFPEEAKNDPSHLLVMFLKKAPSDDDVKALQEAIKGPEIVRAHG